MNPWGTIDVTRTLFFCMVGDITSTEDNSGVLFDAGFFCSGCLVLVVWLLYSGSRDPRTQYDTKTYGEPRGCLLSFEHCQANDTRRIQMNNY